MSGETETAHKFSVAMILCNYVKAVSNISHVSLIYPGLSVFFNAHIMKPRVHILLHETLKNWYKATDMPCTLYQACRVLSDCLLTDGLTKYRVLNVVTFC